jgi:Zn-dependent protease
MSSIEPREFLIAYLVFLFSTTLHEFGHAKVGDRFGSTVAATHGLVTLNPLAHIKRSPFGMVVMPLLSVLYFNWAWPIGWASVPYDPAWAARNPRKEAWMSLAGPAGNILLALLGLGLCKILLATGTLRISESATTLTRLLEPGDGNFNTLRGALACGLGAMVFMNIALGIYNLLPIPPLDGSGVAEGFFPNQVRPLFEKLRRIPVLPMLLYLLAFNYAWHLIQPVQVWAARLLIR